MWFTTFVSLFSLDTLKTCSDIQTAFKTSADVAGASCCGVHDATALKTAFKKQKSSLASVPLASADTDVLVLGGGTGSLGYASRIAAALPQGKTVTVIEAGRFVHPFLQKVTYTIDGVIHKRMLPLNWPAFADSWLTAYDRNGVHDEDSYPQPRNVFKKPYAFVNKTELAGTLRNLLRQVKTTNSSMMVGDLQTIEMKLTSYSPFTKSNVNSTFIGNPIALLDDVSSDVRLSQFIAAGGDSEDIFFYDAYYSNGPASKLQNYPRGKTVGGSSVASAQVHYGLTKQYLKKMATLTKDDEWTSANVELIAKQSNTITCSSECLGLKPNDPKCRGPVFGMCMSNDNWNKDVNIMGERYNQFLHNFNERLSPGQQMNYYTSDFDLEKRMNATITTRSENPYSGARSSSADALANVMGLGVSTCFKPHKNPLILSEHVLPDHLNCDKGGVSATLRIHTGSLVTGLLFDKTGEHPRVTGASYVYEGDQDRPDQNRYYSNVARQCKAAKSLYGNGLDNSLDCMNKGYHWDVLNDGEGDSFPGSLQAPVKARSDISEGVLRSRGTSNLQAGQYAAYQRQIPEDTVLAALKHVKNITAKYEVVLGMGAPATTALLMRSGICDKAESRRLDVDNVADLPTGRMNNNYEYYFQPMVKTIGSQAVSFTLELYRGSDSASPEAFKKSYLTRSALNMSDGYFALKEQNSHIRLFPRKCSNGKYELNNHHLRTFPSTFASTLYTTRATESLDFLLMDTHDGHYLMATPAMLPEMTQGDDSRDNTIYMKLQNTHPLSKIGWFNVNQLTPERCECFYESMHTFMKTLEETYPGVGFESIHYTKRKRSLFDMLTGYDNVYTGSAVVNQAVLNEYFNDTTNPIVAGYRGPNSTTTTDPQEFCSMTNMVNGGHHIMGGAIVGSPDDEMSVSDSKGKVFDVHNLRVADFSGLPISPDGNPWVSVFQYGNIQGYFAAKEHGWNVTAVFENSDPTAAPHPYAVMSA